MENHNCYIEFKVQIDKNFVDLKHTFDLIKEAKNNKQSQPDEFWLVHFPEYSLKHFYFLDCDKKPSSQTAEESEFTWHFYSLVDCYRRTMKSNTWTVSNCLTGPVDLSMFLIVTLMGALQD